MRFCIYGKNEIPANLDKKFNVIANGRCRSFNAVIDLNSKETLIPPSVIKALNIIGIQECFAYEDDPELKRYQELEATLFSILGFSKPKIFVVDIGFQKEIVFSNLHTKWKKDPDGNGGKIILGADILQYGDLIFYGSQKEFFLFRYPKTDDGLVAREILDNPSYVKIKAEVDEKYRYLHGVEQIILEK